MGENGDRGLDSANLLLLAAVRFREGACGHVTPKVEGMNARAIEKMQSQFEYKKGVNSRTPFVHSCTPPSAYSYTPLIYQYV